MVVCVCVVVAMVAPREVYAVTFANSIPQGQVLNAGDTFQSSDGKLRLVQQTDGNLVLYDDKRVVVRRPSTQCCGSDRSENLPETCYCCRLHFK